MSLRCLMLLPVLTSATLAGAQAPGRALPLLQDPGFEEQPGRSWSVRTSFGVCSTVSDRTVKRSGNASLRIDLQRFGGCTVSQTLPAPDAQALSFGCWLRTDLESGDAAYVYMQWLDGQGAVLGSSAPSAAAVGSGEWRPLVSSAQPPGGARQVQVRLVIGRGCAARGGRVWVDDAFLRPGRDVGGAFLNTGFEDDGDADGHPDGWRPFTAGAGFVLSQDNAVAHSGRSSARLTGLPGHGDRSCYGQVSAACTPPAGVRLRLWYKGTGTCDGFVRFRPAPGVALPGGKEFYDTRSFSVPKPGSEWQEYVFTATTPPEASAAPLICVEVTIYQRGEGTLWLDDVSVEGVER